MKKTHLIIWSIVMYLMVCFVEQFVWDVPLISHYGYESYSLSERAFFYVLIILSALSVIFLLKTNSIKNLIINMAIVWLTFGVLCYVIDLRLWGGIITNNETIVLGVNFLGDDIWISYYIGCFIGTIVAIIVTIFRQRKTIYTRSKQ